MIDIIKKTFGWLLDLIFPRRCVLCRAEGSYLCNKCEAGLNLIRGRCSEILFACGHNENPAVARLIEILKYKFSIEIAEILARLLYKNFADFLEMARHKNFAITFVPIHKQRRRWRGFNHAELIARGLGKMCGIPVWNCLMKIKNTPAQVGLNKAKRLNNLSGAFKTAQEFSNVNPSIKNIIIIDDVSTTGATINECAKVLKESGAKKVVGLVLCKER